MFLNNEQVFFNSTVFRPERVKKGKPTPGPAYVIAELRLALKELKAPAPKAVPVLCCIEAR